MSKGGRPITGAGPGLWWVSGASLLYLLFSFYLYQPYLGRFSGADYGIVLNPVLAGVGCFLLSGRWLTSKGAQLAAGAMYGFGPFFLSFGGYHPAAGFIVAGVPWLFGPAAIAARGTRVRRALIALPFCAAAFAVIILFFAVCARYRLFAVPREAHLGVSGLAGLLTPAAGGSGFVIGFYHLPVSVLVMGVLIAVRARRFVELAAMAAGTALAVLGPVFEVSPVVWAAVPVLGLSVMVGLGTEGLVLATRADRWWVLACGIVSVVLSAVALAAGLTADEGAVYFYATRMYGLGAVGMGVIYFLVRAEIRARFARWSILLAGMGIDILFGAQMVVDSVL